MNRISITDFNAGIIDAVDPTLIPDNALTEAENYEYLDLTGLKKRRGVDFSELNDAGFSDIHSFVVWYPSRMPSGATSDKVLIAHADGAISARWLAGSVWGSQILFTDVPDDATVVFYAGYDRVLIADGVNPGRSVSVNKDAELEYGTLGIPAPLTMLEVSIADGDVRYAETDDPDVGMAVERGNILQYCYTVEDKYGNESNPSPLVTEERLCYKYPDSTSNTGFTYYYKSLIITGFSLAGFTEDQIAKIDKFNLYRRSIEFSEGTDYDSFGLVAQIKTTQVSCRDSSAEKLSDISYNNEVAPASKVILEGSGVVYLGGVKPPSIRFPFAFDRYVKITINNDNGIDYCNTVIGFALNYWTLGINQWADYLRDSKQIRLMFSDMITPLPVVYLLEGQMLYIYARVPFIQRSSNLILYLALAETKPGVEPTWNSYRYGRFFDSSDTDLTWESQQVFLPPMAQSREADINILAHAVNDLTRVPNVVDVLSVPETTSWVLSTSLIGNLVNVFGVLRPLTPYPINRETAVVLAITSQIRDKSILYISGMTDNLTRFYLSRTTNFYVQYNATSKRFIIAFGASTYTVPMVVDIYNYFSLAIYINGKDMSVMARRGTLDPIRYNNTFSTAFDAGAVATSITTPFIRNIRLVYVGELTTEEIDRILYSYTNMLPYYPIKVGSDLSAKYSEWSTSDVIAETKEVDTDEKANIVQWSSSGRDGFPSLNFKRHKEDVLAIVDAPSFLKQQYQNTLIVFTRNTVSRIVLSDDLSKMAQIDNNVIEEFKSAGLYSPDSLVSSGNAFYWLSEVGVIRWSPDGLVNLSRGKKNIPLGMNYIGAWVANSAQYLLHNRDTGITYVYHEINDAWTTFTGMSIDKVSYLNLGSDTENRILMYDGENLVEYPATQIDLSVAHKITTKQIVLDNRKPYRYRYMSERGSIADSITASTFNHYLDDKPIVAETVSPMRYEWVYLPNGFWGEYIQLSFDNISLLTRIDLDIREGV